MKSATDSFKIQRRGFVFISIGLSLYYYIEASINQLVLGGVYIEFGNPDALIHSVWVIWVYALIRFVQYFFRDGLKALRSDYQEQKRRVVFPYIGSISSFQYSVLPPDHHLRNSLIQFRLRISNSPLNRYWKTITSPRLIRRGRRPGATKGRQEKTTALEGINLIRPRAIDWSYLLPFRMLAAVISAPIMGAIYVYPPSGKDSIQGVNNEEYQVGFWSVVGLYRRTIFRLFIVDISFFEYIAPFFIGILPIGLALSHKL